MDLNQFISIYKKEIIFDLIITGNYIEDYCKKCLICDCNDSKFGDGCAYENATIKYWLNNFLDTIYESDNLQLQLNWCKKFAIINSNYDVIEPNEISKICEMNIIKEYINTFEKYYFIHQHNIIFITLDIISSNTIERGFQLLNIKNIKYDIYGKTIEKSDFINIIQEGYKNIVDPINQTIFKDFKDNINNLI
jgi:hypothetical protein